MWRGGKLDNFIEFINTLLVIVLVVRKVGGPLVLKLLRVDYLEFYILAS